MKRRALVSRRKKERRKKRSSTAGGMVTVENINTPGRTARVNEKKYTAMRRALMKILPRRTPGITQAGMFQAVREHLPDDLFPGGATAGWWAKTVQLDLESKGWIRRETDSKPMRWHRIR